MLRYRPYVISLKKSMSESPNFYAAQINKIIHRINLIQINYFALPEIVFERYNELFYIQRAVLLWK